MAHSVTSGFPLTLNDYIQHIIWLQNQGYAASTQLSHISSLTFINKLYGGLDPSGSFILRKMLDAVKKGTTNDKRLPITSDILLQLLAKIVKLPCSSLHQSLLYAMLVVAFKAFLRIGELTVRSLSQTHPVPLQIKDCTFHYQSPKITSMSLTLHNTKHNMGKSCQLQLHASDGPLCPVRALQTYLNHTRPTSGPLFQFPNAVPVTRSWFESQLHTLLLMCGFDTKLYTCHSLRIGAATTAALQGISDADIQRFGRWKSSAFHSYIRLPQMALLGGDDTAAN